MTDFELMALWSQVPDEERAEAEANVFDLNVQMLGEQPNYRRMLREANDEVRVTYGDQPWMMEVKATLDEADKRYGPLD